MSQKIKEKKRSKDWSIALTYALTAGIPIPVLFNIFVVIFVLLFRPSLLVNAIISIVLSFLAIYLGVLYSVKYLEKTYLVIKKDKIIKLSTIFYSFLMVLNGLFIYLIRSMESWFMLVTLCQLIVLTVLFHFLSKKYLRNIDISNMDSLDNGKSVLE